MVKNARPSRERILALAIEECARLDIPYLKPEMVLSRDRRGVVAFVRARVIRKLYATGEFSTPGIGKAFGLDHSSIVHQKNRSDLDGPPTGLTQFLTVNRVKENRTLRAREKARILELICQPERVLPCRDAPKVTTAVLASSFIPPIPMARLMAGRA